MLSRQRIRLKYNVLVNGAKPGQSDEMGKIVEQRGADPQLSF
jgi:hypothetical protein